MKPLEIVIVMMTIFPFAMAVFAVSMYRRRNHR